jgi:hypothetical protein
MKLFSKSYDQIVAGFSKVEAELRALIIQNDSDVERMEATIEAIELAKDKTDIESGHATKTADKLLDLLS